MFAAALVLGIGAAFRQSRRFFTCAVSGAVARLSASPAQAIIIHLDAHVPGADRGSVARISSVNGSTPVACKRIGSSVRHVARRARSGNKRFFLAPLSSLISRTADGILLGIDAAIYSMVGLIWVSVSLFGRRGAEFSVSYLTAAMVIMGSVINVLLIGGNVLSLRSRRRPDLLASVRHRAAIATILGLLVVIVPLLGLYGRSRGGGESLVVIYPGYGLWVASVLALWLGSSAEMAMSKTSP